MGCIVLGGCSCGPTGTGGEPPEPNPAGYFIGIEWNGSQVIYHHRVQAVPSGFDIYETPQAGNYITILPPGQQVVIDYTDTNGNHQNIRFGANQVVGGMRQGNFTMTVKPLSNPTGKYLAGIFKFKE